MFNRVLVSSDRFFYSPKRCLSSSPWVESVASFFTSLYFCDVCTWSGSTRNILEMSSCPTIVLLVWTREQSNHWQGVTKRFLGDHFFNPCLCISACIGDHIETACYGIILFLLSVHIVVAFIRVNNIRGASYVLGTIQGSPSPLSSFP